MVACKKQLKSNKQVKRNNLSSPSWAHPGEFRASSSAAATTTTVWFSGALAPPAPSRGLLTGGTLVDEEPQHFMHVSSN